MRDQLNRGIVPDDIDVHCLAGLIKAWFRELPSGVLDGLSPEQVLQCNTEEESVELVKQLKPTEAALLSWAVGLMADVVEEEDSNKMNARNIAMVFSPNMTQVYFHYFLTFLTYQSLFLLQKEKLCNKMKPLSLLKSGNIIVALHVHLMVVDSCLATVFPNLFDVIERFFPLSDV